MTEVKTCKHGHELTPENTYKSGRCKLCFKEYNQRPDVREKIQARRKEYHKEYYKEYAQRPGVKARRKEYHKEYYKEYAQRPGVKAHQKEYQKEYAQRPGVKEELREYGNKKVEYLSSAYLRQTLGITKDEATEDILEIKRLNILLQRSLNNVSKSE